MAKLILHIGTEKTGTTAIQNFMARNRDCLGKHIYYPEIGFAKNAHFSLVAPFHPLDHGGKALEFAPKKNYIAEEEWAPVKELLNSHPDTVVILSAEHFSSRLRQAGLDELKRILDWLGNDIQKEIIMYVRRQDEYLQSWYSTHIKAGGNLTFEEVFRNRSKEPWFLNYNFICNQWAERFGAENLNVAVFNTALKKAGLLEDFCKRCGIEWRDDFDIPVNDEELNRAWPRAMLEFAREIKAMQLFPDNARRYNVLNKISTTFGPEYAGNLLSYEQASSLISRYAQSNRNFTQTYLKSSHSFDNLCDRESWIESPALTRQDIIKNLVKFVP